MIRYALQCDQSHRFEAWFQGSEAFETQIAAGQVVCPDCGSKAVEKSLMAPGVPAKSRSETSAIGPREFFNQVRAFRKEVMASTEDVGRAFPEQARQMHDGDIEHRGIRGHATPEEVQELHEDGVNIAPLPPEPPKEN